MSTNFEKKGIKRDNDLTTRKSIHSHVTLFFVLENTPHTRESRMLKARIIKTPESSSIDGWQAKLTKNNFYFCRNLIKRDKKYMKKRFKKKRTTMPLAWGLLSSGVGSMKPWCLGFNTTLLPLSLLNLTVYFSMEYLLIEEFIYVHR